MGKFTAQYALVMSELKENKLSPRLEYIIKKNKIIEYPKIKLL